MNFELRNFGKIYEADVKLDGITVICGDNNTGKSTVGKALFSFYNSLYDYKSRITEKKISEITTFISNYRTFKTIFSENIGGEIIYEKTMAPSYLYNFITMQNEPTSFNKIKDFLEKDFKIKAPKDKIELLVKNLTLPEDEILNENVFRYFNNIMNNQVKRQNSANGRCVVKAIFKDATNELKFTLQKCDCIIETPIVHKAYYINSPFALDYLNRRNLARWGMPLLERNVIEAIQQAQVELNTDSMSNILDAVSNKSDLEEVKEVLKQAYKGKTKIENGLYVYEEDGMPFDFRNISAGLKAFALIERLLESGVLKKKDVLILDEPEIHLHSEWQIYYAELIVALQKKFDLTILLVTHSFQFLESLNFFMKKYGISDRGNYYIPEETKNGYVLRSDNENLKKIKHNLSTGTFHIADLEFEYDMEHENG